jgi:hypothetical protein
MTNGYTVCPYSFLWKLQSSRRLLFSAKFYVRPFFLTFRVCIFLARMYNGSLTRYLVTTDLVLRQIFLNLFPILCIQSIQASLRIILPLDRDCQGYASERPFFPLSHVLENSSNLPQYLHCSRMPQKLLLRIVAYCLRIAENFVCPSFFNPVKKTSKTASAIN